MTLRSLLFCLANIAATLLGQPGPAVVVDIDVRDEAGRPLPCRVLLRPEGGACATPAVATQLRIGPDVWFMSSGEGGALNRVDAPTGRAELRVERGLEYERHKSSIEIGESRRDIDVTLRRWINMRSRGYHCGENHLHVDAALLGPMLVAEDLDFGTMLQWWRDDRLPVPAGEGNVRYLGFAGRTRPTTIYDAEVEYDWGAVYILNLPDENPVPADRSLPNLTHLQHARRVGALVCYQGGWSPEVVLDAVLGYVDVVNVCNNNWHMHRYQPRRRYSNLLEVEGFPNYDNTPAGMLRMNTETYYRLLNMGLRLAAGAGSATGVKEVPVGYNRSYVRCGADASIGDFYRAWAAGKNFVTNGPMLFLQTADGQRPGDSIDLPADGGLVTVEIEAVANQPLAAVELVVNGQVEKTFAVESDYLVKGMAEVEVAGSSWIAARCVVRDDYLSDAELQQYANGEKQQPTRMRFAHTSPIYVSVEGQEVAVRRSIQEGLRMLSELERFADGRVNAASRNEFQQAVAEARRRLETKLVERY